MRRARRYRRADGRTFAMTLLGTRERDADTLFIRARDWNRIAHLSESSSRRLAYSSKTEALIGAIRLHPERFHISSVEEGGRLICVQCARTRRSLHIERAELEYRCPDWWRRAVALLKGEPVFTASQAT